MQGGAGPGTPEVHLLGRADVTVRTISGDNQPGMSDGASYRARFDRPTGISLDTAGNLYVADTGNHRIRMVAPNGDTTTVAGGEQGYADGPTAQAKFNAPCGVCLGPDGTVYVADSGNHCLRRISGGQVTTLGEPPPAAAPGSGHLNLPTGIAFVPGAVPYLAVADTGASLVAHYSLDGKRQGDRSLPGGPVAVAGNPEDVAVPSAATFDLGGRSLKNILFEQTDEVPADQAARVALKHPLSALRWGPNWLATDSDHGALLMIVNGKARVIAGYCSSMGPVRGFRDGSGQFALFGTLCGLAFDGKQFAYVSDTANNSIRRIDVSELNSN
jgi:DNA-binding beta-propeller fold protein YncE